jgi:hemolysin activation/secretion protein
MSSQHLFTFTKLSVAVGLSLASVAHAQVAPDAGQTLQQQQQQPVAPPKPQPGIDIAKPSSSRPAPGGMTVNVDTLVFQGNTVFTAAQLDALLADAKSKPLDMAGLWSLADRVSDHYRRAGYPFARAFLPQQQLQNGTLTIEVVEGRYGQIKTTGPEGVSEAARRFLAPLKPGDVIESDALERTTLIIDDLPGIRATPLIRPGQDTGTGDLDVQIEQTPRLQGSFGLDNQGNRYTGPYRARIGVSLDSPFMLGDQLTAHALGSNDGLWYGGVGYSAPLGHSGLRGHVDATQTRYELGREFESLEATGTAKVLGAGVSYPIVRSQRVNLTVDASVQHKLLRDRQKVAGIEQSKSSKTLPLSLSFDVRDNWAGGGITYGALVFTHGELSLDASLRATDQTTARTEGDFDKATFDITRIQALTGASTLYLRAATQWASQNLDSSEGFGLGGPGGVRAYPTGEAYGDTGWLAQVEWRHDIGKAVPYVFYDAGYGKTNKEAWTPDHNTRFLSGAGVGVRSQWGTWSLEGSLAWRIQGGRPTSETGTRVPQVWAAASMRF